MKVLKEMGEIGENYLLLFYFEKTHNCKQLTFSILLKQNKTKKVQIEYKCTHFV